MAVKRKSRAASRRVKEPEMMPEPVVSEMTVAEDKSKTAKKMENKGVLLGWVLLLVGGLAHMMPEQMTPVLNYSLLGVTVQMAVGVLSVVVALYYLLGD